jgi:hypothetical protein
VRQPADLVPLLLHWVILWTLEDILLPVPPNSDWVELQIEPQPLRLQLSSNALPPVGLDHPRHQRHPRTVFEFLRSPNNLHSTDRRPQGMPFEHENVEDSAHKPRKSGHPGCDVSGKV